MFQHNSSYRYYSTNLWSVLFQFEGNILIAVLPYCIVNCLVLALVAHFHNKDDFGFSPAGHGLLTLLVSFLVINKVNLAYDRFRSARHWTGTAFLQLWELNQHVICVSSTLLLLSNDDDNDNDDDTNKAIQYWRSETVSMIIQLLDCTKRVIQDEDIAKYLAKNNHIMQDNNDNDNDNAPPPIIDPLSIVQSLRLHLYSDSTTIGLQLLERVTLVTKLDSFVASYRHLLDYASTPLIQMGRAFLFLWTFSMPLVLLQGPFTDLWTAMVFLFFLTYGFIGLELVAMKLVEPFGDGRHDVQVTNIRDVRGHVSGVLCVFLRALSRLYHTIP